MSGQIDYEQLAQSELDKASQSTTPDRQRDHLNQAAKFAAEGEKQRLARADAGGG